MLNLFKILYINVYLILFLCCRFSDKQLRYIRFKSGRQIVENKCCDFLRQKKSLNDIKTDLKFTKERIKLLQLIVSDKREIIKRRFTELEHLKEHNTKLRIKLPKYGDRVEKLQQYLQDKNEDLEMQKKKIEKTYTVLKDCVKTNIKILLKYIFPITPIYPQLNRTEEDVSQVCYYILRNYIILIFKNIIYSYQI